MSTDSSNMSEPDYSKLVKFLCEPFLVQPESLRLDCEVSKNKRRVLIRLAIEGEDKGRIFGRGGRNIQAIRTVLQAIAKIYSQSAYLEVFGSSSHSDSQGEGKAHDNSERPRPSRPSRGDRPRPSRPHRAR